MRSRSEGARRRPTERALARDAGAARKTRRRRPVLRQTCTWRSSAPRTAARGGSRRAPGRARRPRPRPRLLLGRADRASRAACRRGAGAAPRTRARPVRRKRARQHGVVALQPLAPLLGARADDERVRDRRSSAAACDELALAAVGSPPGEAARGSATASASRESPRPRRYRPAASRIAKRIKIKRDQRIGDVHVHRARAIAHAGRRVLVAFGRRARC